MNILGMGSGKKEFMTFHSYKYDDIMFEKPDKEYQVMINPDQFTKSITPHYTKQESQPEETDTGNFSGMQPIDYSFSLMLDGTGVVPTSKDRGDVQKQLEELTNIFFDISGGEGYYKPNNVAITYCNEIFHCRINSFKTDYSLFKPDGTPLRVKVTCSFKSVCYKGPKKEPEKKTDSKGESAFDKFTDAISEAYEEMVDSLFNLPRL